MPERFSDEQLGAALEASATPAASGRSSAAWPPPRLSSSRSWRARWPRAAGSTPRTSSGSPDVAALEDPEERLTHFRTLLAEEARMGMLVGVAVGWELARELPPSGTTTRLLASAPDSQRFPNGHPLSRPLHLRALRRHARVLVDPFLAPNNPKAPVSADDVDPTHILLTHAHVDHIADAAAVAKRTGRSDRRAGRDRRLARLQGSRERLRPEPRRHGHLRLGLGEAGAGPPQLDDARRHRHLRERPGDQHRRHHRVPPRRHVPVR